MKTYKVTILSATERNEKGEENFASYYIKANWVYVNNHGVYEFYPNVGDEEAIAYAPASICAIKLMGGED